ncbi:MAG: hypothetical protein MK005_03665 [Alcanivorax sp.]|nr:hypothetical protein [Alcanivorax sp.]
MDLHVSWQNPLFLRNASASQGIYSVDINRIPAQAGVYIFLRIHGESAKALYVGKAKNLKSRVKQQLNNVQLMKGIESAANGQRRLLIGVFEPKPGQSKDSSIARIEKALIRHYLAKGDALINKQGTRIKSGTVRSQRTALKKFIPTAINFEE